MLPKKFNSGDESYFYILLRKKKVDGFDLHDRPEFIYLSELRIFLINGFMYIGFYVFTTKPAYIYCQ